MNFRNTDLKTKHRIISSKLTAVSANSLNIGQVPAGMTRWFTFLMLDTMNVAGASVTLLYIASVSTKIPTRVSMVLAANRKMALNLRATGLSTKSGHCPEGMPPICIPQRGPNVNIPLFSIAASKFIGCYCSGASAYVFVQYFDEEA